MRAAYDTIYFELKHLIEEGTYSYRTFLPSESMLVKRFGCAHNTVRKALAALATEGYAQPIHGKGVRVIYRPPSNAMETPASYTPTGIESFHDTSMRCGFDGTTQVVLMESLIAGQRLAELTRFEPGDKLVHLERIRSYNGIRLLRESNYFCASTVQGMSRQDAEASVYNYIETTRHQKLVTTKRRITVEPVNEDDKSMLELEGVTHVAVMRVLTFDGNGFQCEYSELRHHPDAFSLTQTIVNTRISKGEE